ncbi:MAG: FmdE family protein [Methanobrevibacter sp.]|uniref:FmdE family protein n=1 Tax=Methanobrevibacter sp. TaxID=66852 RepID=UPI003F089F9B
MSLIACLMIMIGAVSAENNDTVSDYQNTSNINNDIPEITLTEQDSQLIKSSSNELSSGGSNSVSVNVKVNYEYKNDANKLVPDFYVVSNGKYLNYTKIFDVDTRNYILTIKNFNGNSLNISAMTAGYGTETKMIDATILNNLITFNLKASDAYKLGEEVTSIADKKLDFKNADDILVITTAGVAKYHGKTSEDAMEAIVNYGDIAYSNVIMLRQSATDPVDFAFIIKKGNDLRAIIFQNGSTEYSYLGTISEDMSKKDWNKYFKAIVGENSWAFASLANGWNAGVSREILQEAAFHGHICEGTLGGYSIIQALLKYYPPEQETSVGGVGSPGDITAYKVLGVPGGSDDDAALFFLDDTIGKTGYSGMNTTNTGATENMIGFIKWNAKTKTGDLIIMSFDSAKLKKLFTKETGINPDAGSLEELKYCSWWIKQINKNPEDLVDFLYEFTGLNQEQYNYLMGTTENVTYDGEPAEYGIDGHGLDLKYILSLNLPKATRATSGTINHDKLTDDEIKQIGIDAANKAKEIFKEFGIEISRDNVDVLALTDAGYAFLNGQDTVIARDGLYEVLGGTLYSQNVLSLHQAVWKPLWFAFAVRYPDSDLVNMIYLRYNPDTKDFFVGTLDGDKVVNIGFETLNNSAKLRAIEKSFVPDGNWFNIQSLINAWNEHPLFDQMATFLYHAHVCPGVQPGFFITDYIQQNYPLGENESYTYIASNIYCKDDSLTYLLDLSPGLGTFLVQKLPSNETQNGLSQGILIVWDDNLKIGRAMVVDFKNGQIDTSKYATSEAKRANTIKGFIDMYSNRPNADIISRPTVKMNFEKWITEEQFNMLKQGAGDNHNPISYLKSLDNVTKEDLLKARENNSNSNNPNSNVNGDHTNSNYTSNSNSKSSNSNNPVSQSTSSSSYSTSIGTSGAVATNAPSETDVDSNDGPSDAKSYEVSKTPAVKTADSNSLIYALIGVLVIGIILGLGYMKRKDKDQ